MRARMHGMTAHGLVLLLIWGFFWLGTPEGIAAHNASATPGDASPRLQFRRFTLADGLPGRRIRDVRQDAAGFIWVAGDAGLVRYDGESFNVVGHDAAEPEHAVTHRYNTLFVDRAGGLWAGGEAGLGRHDASGVRMWRRRSGDASTLASDDVTAIAQAADGRMWVATDGGGLHRLSVGGCCFEHWRHRLGDLASLASDSLRALFVEPGGGLWIGTDAGLDHLDEQGLVHHVVIDDESGSVRVNDIAGDERGLRVSTDKGLFVRDGNTLWRRLPGLPQVVVHASLRARDGVLWVATDAGVYLVDVDGAVAHVPPQPSLIGGLPGKHVVSLTQDREGGIWLAVADGGLAYLGPYWARAFLLTHQPGESHSLPARDVTALAVAADDTVWVGGAMGWLRRLDIASGRVVEALPRQLSRIHSLLVDRRGRLWIGTLDGLVVYEQRRRHVVASPLPLATVGHLVEGPDGSVQGAMGGGVVFSVDPTTLVASIPVQPASVACEGEVRQLIWHDAMLWRACPSGLARKAANDAPWIPVGGVRRDRVTSIAFIEGGFWLTRSDVLERYRWQHGQAVFAERIDHAHGWPAGALSIHADATGDIWAFTVNQLWYLDVSRGQARTFGVANGFFGTEFTSGSTVTMASGTVLAMSLDGVVGFEPDGEPLVLPAPAIVPTRITVLRDGRQVELPVDGGPVRLGWRDRDLAIAVRALSYVDSSTQRYQFRLHGRDTTWFDGARRGYREFYGLSPGHYVLDVRSSSPAGGPGRLREPLVIDIEAPPWQRWWAWLGYVVAGIATGWLVHRELRRRIARRLHLELAEQGRQLAESASEAKSHFIGMLGHELRTPMTGVLGMAELLSRTSLSHSQQRYVAAMQQSGGLLLKLVDNALDLARIEANRVELELAPFDPVVLAGQVVALMAPSAQQAGLTLRMQAEEGLPALTGDALRIRQILHNLLGNAVKFTVSGEVVVSVAAASPGVVFTVADTGRGIDPADIERLFCRFEQGAATRSQQGVGLGLAICQELTSLMGGHIDVDSKRGSGSTFRVTLPLAIAHADAKDDTSPMQAAPTPSMACNVLVVDDDPVVGEVLAGLLTADGHHATVVPHALAALSAVEAGDYGVALLDLDLPGVDGYALARMLKRLPRHRAMPLVGVSARSMGEEPRLTREAGMFAFLRKPVSGDDLRTVMAQVASAS